MFYDAWRLYYLCSCSPGPAAVGIPRCGHAKVAVARLSFGAANARVSESCPCAACVFARQGARSRVWSVRLRVRKASPLCTARLPQVRCAPPAEASFLSRAATHTVCPVAPRPVLLTTRARAHQWTYEPEPHAMFATIFSILAGAAEDPAAAEAALREQLKDIPEGAIAAEINNDVARRLMHALSSFVYDGAAVQPGALRVAAELLARIAQSGEEEPLASLKNAGLEEFVVKVRAARARAPREVLFGHARRRSLRARACAAPP